MLRSCGERSGSRWGEGYLQIFTEIKIEMFRKLRKEFTHGKLPSTDAWQLAESIVSQSWMLKVVFGVNVNEISLRMPGTMYVSIAPLALVGAVCWTYS